MKSWPQVKLGEVDLNIAQISRLASCLVIIFSIHMKHCPNMKLGNNVPQFGFIYYYLALIFCPYFAFNSYIYLPTFNPILGLNCPYLIIFALHCPYVHMYSSLETAPLVQNFESNWTITRGDIAFQWIGGYRKCHHKCPWAVYLVIDKFLYVTFDSSPLYETKSNWTPTHLLK